MKLITRKCLDCLKEFDTNKPEKVFCSRTCRRHHSTANSGLTSEFPKMAPSTVGTISELRVSVDLLSKGYEVFRALSPACSCDLAILKDGTLRRIEVRTGYRHSRNGKLYYMNQHRADHVAVSVASEIVYLPELPK